MISWRRPWIVLRNHKLYESILLTNVLLSTFLSVLSTVSTIMAVGVIQGELALSKDQATWLTTLNLLGVNTVVPAASWFGDRFGYKTMMGIGIILFALSTVIAAASINFPMLGLARLLEGIGAGLIFPVGLATITHHLPPKTLSLFLILYVCVAFGGGFSIGLPLSGYLTQFASWRWIFILIAIFSSLTFISLWIFHVDTERKKTVSFDYLGYIFLALFISSLLFALTYAPMASTAEGWRSPYILGCLGVSFLSLIITIFIEKTHTNPILPLVLFHYPIYATTCVALFLLGMSIYASATSLMLYMIDGIDYERFVSGKISIVYGISIAVCSILSSSLIKKIPIPIVTGFGLALLVYSFFLNNILNWQTGVKQVLLILFLRGVAIGLALGPATVQALKAIPESLKNKASTILTLFRQIGATYGGTLISMIVIKRQIFHTVRFGEQTNKQLPGFQIASQKLQNHYHSSFGDTIGGSQAFAKATIVKNIETQAYIQAINDSMIVFGYITLAIMIIYIFLSTHNWHKERKEKFKRNQDIIQ